MTTQTLDELKVSAEGWADLHDQPFGLTYDETEMYLYDLWRYVRALEEQTTN